MSGTGRPNFIEHLGTQNRATEPARIQEHSRRRQIILAELCKEFHPQVETRSNQRPNLEHTLGSLWRQPTPYSRSGFWPPQRVSNNRPFAPHKQGRIAAALAAILPLGSLPVISHALACLARPRYVRFLRSRSGRTGKRRPEYPVPQCSYVRAPQEC